MSENIYETFGSEVEGQRPRRSEIIGNLPVAEENRRDNDTSDKIQWAYMGDKNWTPCGTTAEQLPSGIFSVEMLPNGQPKFHERNTITDSLYRLPDAATDYILSLIETFWASKDKFKERGYLFKRGILLCGAPGGGKTSIIHLLCQQLLDLGGLVIFAEYPGSAKLGLESLRRIEPNRPLICILEDLDELVSHSGEAEWLSLLDGENQVDNIVYVGTTNYPKKLDRRFINRPSRFDEIVVVDMPTAEARRRYLEIKSHGDLSDTEIERWVEDTEGMSVAHLKEMYVAVFCLGIQYETVLARLKTMQKGKYKDADDIAAINGFRT